MKKKHFIFILVFYLITVVSGVIVEALTESLIPSNVIEMEKMDEPCCSLILIIGPIILLGAITGIFGMFFFWKPAIYLFAMSVITKIIISPLLGAWYASTNWKAIFSEIELLLDGIIITLVFFGPARDLFIKKTPNKSMQRT